MCFRHHGFSSWGGSPRQNARRLQLWHWGELRDYWQSLILRKAIVGDFWWLLLSFQRLINFQFSPTIPFWGAVTLVANQGQCSNVIGMIFQKFCILQPIITLLQILEPFYDTRVFFVGKAVAWGKVKHWGICDFKMLFGKPDTGLSCGVFILVGCTLEALYCKAPLTPVYINVKCL